MARCRKLPLRVRIESRPDRRKREDFVFDLTGMSWSCRIALAALLCSLGACGGGGGSGSAPGSSVTASVNSVSVQANVTDASVAPSLVTLTASNVPGAGLYVRAASTNNGISTLSPGAFNASSAQIQIFFKNPYTLSPATYTDTVQIQVCPESSCSTQVSGSPISISVKYAIAAVVGSAAPTVSTNLGPLFAQALPTDTFTPGAPGGGVAITNAPTFPLTVMMTATSNGLQTVTLQQPLINFGNGSLAGPMQIDYKPPNQLAEGVYQDSVTVTACLDPACVNPLAGSPVVIQSTYQIGNSVPGPNGYTVGMMGLQANDLVWDPQHSVIYASVAATSATRANTVVALNPVTGAVSGFVSLGSEPGRLAISDDGTELYVGLRTVGSIQRLSLPSLTPDLSIPLSSIPVLGQLYAFDLAVVPGNSKSTAVSLVNQGWPPAVGNFSEGGVAVFDDATMRPNLGNPFSSSRGGSTTFVAWGPTGATLYGTGTDGFQSFAVDAKGLTPGGIVATNVGGRLQYLSGRVYTDNGPVVDASSGAIIGSLPSSIYRHRVIPDGPLSRIFSLDDSGSQSAINVFDLSTFAPIKSFQILGATLASAYLPSFITWGTNGIAYTASNGQIVIVSGPYLQQ
jgi:hypothetical protein